MDEIFVKLGLVTKSMILKSRGTICVECWICTYCGLLCYCESSSYWKSQYGIENPAKEPSVWNGSVVALLVVRRTNNRKVVGSRPTKVVCFKVLTGVNCPLWPAATPSSEL